MWYIFWCWVYQRVILLLIHLWCVVISPQTSWWIVCVGCCDAKRPQFFGGMCKAHISNIPMGLGWCGCQRKLGTSRGCQCWCLSSILLGYHLCISCWYAYVNVVIILDGVGYLSPQVLEVLDEGVELYFHFDDRFLFTLVYTLYSRVRICLSRSFFWSTRV